MSVKFSNNGHSTLAASLTNSATSITVASGHGARFPSLTGSEYFYATLIDSSNNLEIVKVTARSSDVLTVTRAQESTTARAYAIGDRVELRVTAQGLVDVGTPTADSITNAMMADDAIDTPQIADDAITAALIDDNAVGAAALNVSGNGSSGQALISDGDGTMTWGAGGGILQVKQFTKTSSVDVGTNNDDLVLFAPFDGSATITPAAAGNMIVIDYMATIDHGQTWRSAKNRAEYSTDGGSNYKAIAGGAMVAYVEGTHTTGNMINISCMFNPNTTNAVKVRIIHNGHNSGHGRLYTYNGESSSDGSGTGSNDTDTVGGVKAVTTAMRLTEVVASAATLSTTA